VLHSPSWLDPPIPSALLPACRLAGQLHISSATGKTVYLAPLRALVQEKVKDWQAR